MISNTRVAVVGCGHWGKNLVRNFHGLGVLDMICDSTDTGRAAAAAIAPDVPIVATWDEVLSNAECTAMVIATPAETHYSLARRALDAGKDVYVEKPLCLSNEEGRDLVEYASAHNRILMVGHLLQYHPCVETIQKMVAEGQLGKLYTIVSNRLNLGKIRQEENALWSFAPHDISVILSLAGNRLPQHIACSGGAHLQLGICDTTLTAMTFQDGLKAHVYVSWLNPFKEQKLTVVGSGGMVVFDDTRPWKEKLVHYPDYLTWSGGSIPIPKKDVGRPIDLPEDEPLRRECAHFLECCRSRSIPKTDGAEGLRVLETLNLAQQSLEQGGIPVIPPKSVPVSPLSSAVTAERDYFQHATACVDEGAQIGAGTKIWHFCHVMKGAKIGERCICGQNVNVDKGAVIGNNVKIQNNVSIYSGITIEDDVFLGPSCVLTNVTNPRSQVARHSLYEKTLIRRGATIGANATILCGVTIGRYAFVGAGAVVTKDIPDYALVVGNPARQTGWMSRHGHLLNFDAKDVAICPESGYRYRKQEETIKCLDLDEETPLPVDVATGTTGYHEFKKA